MLHSKFGSDISETVDVKKNVKRDKAAMDTLHVYMGIWLANLVLQCSDIAIKVLQTEPYTHRTAVLIM